MQPRSLATRLIAPAAAVFLALTVAGCGSEVEGTATSQSTASSSAQSTGQQRSTQQGDKSASSGSSSATTAKSRASLEVTELSLIHI